MGRIGNRTMNAAAAAEQAFRPDRAWWERVLAVVDAGDAAGFVDLLTPDAQFRFGNAPPIFGSDAIRSVVAGFFAAIASSRHELLEVWSDAATAVCEGLVTYTRHDGSSLTVPFANVFQLKGHKIAGYRIYIDNSALFAEAG
jgi:ketosteroid isomerase-like protein